MHAATHESKERVILFFGSFNPVHKGHLAVAKTAIQLLSKQYPNDQVTLKMVVSPHNPLKSRAELFPENDRLEMVKLATNGEPGLEWDDIEFSMGQPTFTARTLERYRADSPQTIFYLLIGEDNLMIFDKWKDYKQILITTPILVYPREGDSLNFPFSIDGLDITFLPAAKYNLSATEIRHKIKNNEEYSQLVPAAIIPKLKSLASTLTLLLLFLLHTNCNSSLSPSGTTRTEMMMNTVVNIKIYHNRADAVLNEAFHEIERVEKLFDSVQETGTLYAFNQGGLTLSNHEIASLVAQAKIISELSFGAFDITVTPLMNLWGFYNETPTTAPPSSAAIEKLLPTIGYHHIAVTPPTITKLNKEVKIDLGGIAKGYAVDCAVQVLKKQGVKSGLVDAGGDVYVFGEKPDRSPYRIGIKDPFLAGDNLVGVVEVSDAAIVTSGNYERYFIYEGRRYHHLLNPVTGYPSQGVVSVSVLYSNTALADAYATAIFVSGVKDGLAIANKMRGMEVLIIDESTNYHATGRFLEFVPKKE